MEQRSRHLPWVTISIGAVCVALYGVATYWGDGSYNMAIWRMGANSGEQVRAGQWWRLLSSAFLHGNLIHLIVNMVALASFGPMLEQLLGARRFLILYALAALIGALASAFLREGGSSVGASGAIWGLMTGAIGLAIWPRGLLPAGAFAAARQQLMIPLAINFFYSFQPGVDYLAHFGGGAVGFVLMATGVITRGVAARNERRYGPMFGVPSQLESGLGSGVGDVAEVSSRERSVAFVAALLSVAMAGSVALAIVNGKPWMLRASPQLTRVAIGTTGFSLELPASIADQAVSEVDGTTNVATYATLQTSPIAVELRYGPMEPPILAEQMDAFMEQMRIQIAADAPKDAAHEGPATKVVIGGQPYIRAAFAFKNKVRVFSWFSTNGGSIISVRVYAQPEMPRAWSAMQDVIGQSLRVAR